MRCCVLRTASALPDCGVGNSTVHSVVSLLSAVQVYGLGTTPVTPICWEGFAEQCLRGSTARYNSTAGKESVEYGIDNRSNSYYLYTSQRYNGPVVGLTVFLRLLSAAVFCTYSYYHYTAKRWLFPFASDANLCKYYTVEMGHDRCGNSALDSPYGILFPFVPSIISP